MKNKFSATGLGLLVLVLCLVAACGGGGDSTTSPATTSPATTTTPATTSPPATTPTANGDVLEGLFNKWTGLEPVSYVMTSTVTGQPMVEGKIWQTNSKIRMEFVMEGVTTIVIFDLDENVTYTYLPDQNMAMKATLDPGTMPQGTLEGDMSAVLEYDPVIVGTETIDGKSCTVIEFAKEGMTVNVWIWTETGFPLRSQGITSDGTTMLEEYTNIDFSDIPDSMFELPEGVEIISM